MIDAVTRGRAHGRRASYAAVLCAAASRARAASARSGRSVRKRTYLRTERSLDRAFCVDRVETQAHRVRRGDCHHRWIELLVVQRDLAEPCVLRFAQHRVEAAERDEALAFDESESRDARMALMHELQTCPIERRDGGAIKHVECAQSFTHDRYLIRVAFAATVELQFQSQPDLSRRDQSE